MRPALGSVLAPVLASVLVSVLVTLVLSASLGLATANAAITAVVAAPADDGGDVPTWPFAVGTIAAVAVVALWAARRGR
ncbi:hypothetical protein H7J11_23065 [Mycobacterium bourgelatii]|uniref:Uncharacterized protein n=1 Tax=Mycobacterium bourgelatii TaxID=1273442 RepID=A0A7I9YXZ1_MYCBU|nr:hypothetical protein [Mycobacterium bourgelatii]GFG93610.1 hypothetical protein MBOU_56520 [Mycobacterium bourgelatii]